MLCFLTGFQFLPSSYPIFPELNLMRDDEILSLFFNPCQNLLKFPELIKFATNIARNLLQLSTFSVILFLKYLKIDGHCHENIFVFTFVEHLRQNSHQLERIFYNS